LPKEGESERKLQSVMESAKEELASKALELDAALKENQELRNELAKKEEAMVSLKRAISCGKMKVGQGEAASFLKNVVNENKARQECDRQLQPTLDDAKQEQENNTHVTLKETQALRNKLNSVRQRAMERNRPGGL
jgi:hypothetical protein